MDDAVVFSLARSGGDNAGIATGLCLPPRSQRFGQGSTLVWFDQDGVTSATSGRLGNERGVGDQKIIPDDLHAIAGGPGKCRKSVRVIFSQGVFDRNDGVSIHPTQQHFAQAIRIQFPLFEPQSIAAPLTEFGCSDIQRDGNLVPRCKSGHFDRSDQRIERMLILSKVRPPTAFIGDPSELAARCHPTSCRRVDLSGPLKCLGKTRCPRASDHEILNVDPSTRMRAAPKNLDLRQRN